MLRQDPERVGETETSNLFTAPNQAHNEMQVNANAAKAIQECARAERGERSAASGSRSEKNCFHYALSWHPDDEPSTERMMRFAHQTLERLGLAEHQAIIVEHTEKAHRHLHVVVSTVHPETGCTNGLYRSAYVLNRCAHEQETEIGIIRTFKRAAVFDREHEWEKNPSVKTLSEGEKKAAWGKRQRKLFVAREKDAQALKAKHAARKEAHEDRVNEVRRNAAIDKRNIQDRYRQEINTHWRKQAPRPQTHLRPPASFTRPGSTLGGEMGRALKGLVHTTYHSTTVVAERRTMEQNKNLARNTFARARVSEHPLEKPAPVTPPRSNIYGQFRDRSENSHENHLRHHGISDGYEGAKTIKRWQRDEIADIDRRTRELIDRLHEERDTQLAQDKSEWDQHKEHHAALKEAARKELGIEPSPQERAQAENAERQRGDVDKSRSGPDGDPVATESRSNQPGAPQNVQSYVDDYIAGRGRDSADHEQFASNNGAEIEQEFQRRAAETSRSAEPEPAPPFGPDAYVPDHYAEPDIDFARGD